MTRPTRSSHHSATTAALLVLLGVFPARATEPTCPAGEITLSAGLLRATRNGAGADRLSAPTSNFVLPAGVSIDPGTEALSFVVEGDHRLLYQADVPAGGLVAHAEHRSDTIFIPARIVCAPGCSAGRSKRPRSPLSARGRRRRTSRSPRSPTPTSSSPPASSCRSSFPSSRTRRSAATSRSPAETVTRSRARASARTRPSRSGAAS